MATHGTTVIIVPGWRDSGPGHWQSLWAERYANTMRVRQDDWITPVRDAWVRSITRTILEQPGPVVIAAHSLGCIATMHLPPEAVARIQGALLVAPADPERRSVLIDFAPVPSQALPYRNIVVASSNDPFCPVRLAGAYGRGWGSDFVRLQSAGHINVDSGHGEWPLGVALLQSLMGEESLRLRTVAAPTFTPAPAPATSTSRARVRTTQPAEQGVAQAA